MMMVMMVIMIGVVMRDEFPITIIVINGPNTKQIAWAARAAGGAPGPPPPSCVAESFLFVMCPLMTMMLVLNVYDFKSVVVQKSSLFLMMNHDCRGKKN